MALIEAFAHQAPTALSVQVRDLAGITSMALVDVFFFQTNTGPHRTGAVILDIDGDLYNINFTLSEDTIDQRTVQGYTKRKNPNQVGR